MFRWYHNAALCYAFLSDVDTQSEFGQSRWFTRGWTLQELIAPKSVLFYSSDWKYLSSKHDLAKELEKITGIESEVLSTGEFTHLAIAVRMSWAASRQTTRIEDIAYCLLGIFNINMPLLYGEGKRSFVRLQEEILKVSEDQSLFAWGMPSTFRTVAEFLASEYVPSKSQMQSLFANSPADFIMCHQILPVNDLLSDIPPTLSSRGLQLQLPVWTRGSLKAAAISCALLGRYQLCICIPLFSWSERYNARCGDLLLIPPGEWCSSPSDIKSRTQPLFIKTPALAPASVKLETFEPPAELFKIILFSKGERKFLLEEVYYLPHATFLAESGMIKLSEMQAGPHAILFISEKKSSQLRFAVVLGGYTANFNQVWIRYIEILGPDYSNTPFKTWTEHGPGKEGK